MTEKESASKLPLDQLHFLDLCALFELKIGDLYTHFAKLFAEDAELSSLWRKTALEEENHAQQFRMAVRLQGSGIKYVNTDLSKAVANLRKLQAAVEKYIGMTLSPQDALRLAIKLEDQVAVLHMDTIVVFEDPELKRLFEAMMECDKGHVSMLQNYLDRISG